MFFSLWHRQWFDEMSRQDLYNLEGHLWPKQQMLVAGCSERRVPHLARSGGDHETYCFYSRPPHRHMTAPSTRREFSITVISKGQWIQAKKSEENRF